MSQIKVHRWRSYGAELFFATALGGGGAGCLIYGLQSITSLLKRLETSPVRAVQSETGVFVFGGLALLLAGFVLYLVTPTGGEIDMDKGEVRTWRGLFPRLATRRYPADGAELVLTKVVYRRKGQRRTVHKVVLEFHGQKHTLEYDRKREVMVEKGRELASRLGMSLIERP